MNNIIPKTYKELRAYYKCQALFDFIPEFTHKNDLFNEIYNFILEDSHNTVAVTPNMTTFFKGGQTIKTLEIAASTPTKFSSVVLSDTYMKINPVAPPKSSYSGSSGGCGGNNNNNNNNNA